MISCFYAYAFDTDETALSVFESGHAQIFHPWSWSSLNPPFSRMYYMLQGQAEVVIDHQSITLKEGYVYLLPSGCSIQTFSSTHMEQLFFHVNLFDYAGFDVLTQCKIGEGLPVPDIEELVRLYRSNDTLDFLALRQRIALDCIHFLRESGVVLEAKSCSSLVRRVVAYVKKNLKANLSVMELCDQLYVSKNALNYAFQKEIGKTVGAYIDDLVLEKSRTLLFNASLSLAQVSDTLGFCDQFYFSRKFKKKYGVSPSVYRRDNLSSRQQVTVADSLNTHTKRMTL